MACQDEGTACPSATEGEIMQITTVVGKLSYYAYCTYLTYLPGNLHLPTGPTSGYHVCLSDQPL